MDTNTNIPPPGTTRKGREPKHPRDRRVMCSGRVTRETADFIDRVIASLPEKQRNAGRAIDKIVSLVQDGTKPLHFSGDNPLDAALCLDEDIRSHGIQPAVTIGEENLAMIAGMLGVTSIFVSRLDTRKLSASLKELARRRERK